MSNMIKNVVSYGVLSGTIVWATKVEGRGRSVGEQSYQAYSPHLTVIFPELFKIASNCKKTRGLRGTSPKKNFQFNMAETPIF